VRFETTSCGKPTRGDRAQRSRLATAALEFVRAIDWIARTDRWITLRVIQSDARVMLEGDGTLLRDADFKCR